MEAGPTYLDAMGSERALDWLQVHAYQSSSQAICEPWEARALVNLSRAYLEGKAIGTNPLGLEPLTEHEGKSVGHS
ncbi:hypothetical protein SAMN06265373_1217 [Shimia sagamensis]|uniref:Uncharacterized protein n=1 Tax=Shimia sagamensis TaxID=1566352 RepID=A0ABY1PP40_9RHOB|nr:hypothetical protein SAMN06265373_1217 [Shimia sagamensis]